MICLSVRGTSSIYVMSASRVSRLLYFRCRFKVPCHIIVDRIPYLLFRFRQKAGHEFDDGIVVLTMFILLCVCVFFFFFFFFFFFSNIYILYFFT